MTHFEDQEYFVSTLSLQQSGRAIFGEMQGKFAATNYIHIRGLLIDYDRLVANIWRELGASAGSGILDLRITEESQVLSGSLTWYSIDDSADLESNLVCRQVNNR